MPQGRPGQVRKISLPTGIRSPDRPARRQSLYRLRYPAHMCSCRGTKISDGEVFIYFWFLEKQSLVKASLRVCFAYFLGAFAKRLKAIIRVFMSVCLSVLPSVYMEELGSHWTYSYEIWYLGVFSLISIEKIQVLLKSDKNNGYFT
jgi:hypothetical protein